MKRNLPSTLLWSLLFLLGACGGAATATPIPDSTRIPAATVVATTEPPEAPALQPASQGQQLFVSKGCSACHGAQGEGTVIAPALGGHTGGQVKRQVRSPVGLMPVYPPDKISDQELEQIAQYVTSLAVDHQHMKMVDPGEAIIQHHWMALFALDDGDRREAIHHIRHIIELVSGGHLARMQEALRMAESGELHDAEHIIQGMLAGTASLDLTPKEMHLRLAASSARVEDAADALHHLQHYLELAEPGSSGAAAAREAVSHLQAGELAQAADEISRLAGTEVAEKGHDEEGAPHQEPGDDHHEGEK